MRVKHCHLGWHSVSSELRMCVWCQGESRAGHRAGTGVTELQLNPSLLTIMSIYDSYACVSLCGCVLVSASAHTGHCGCWESNSGPAGAVHSPPFQLYSLIIKGHVTAVVPEQEAAGPFAEAE